MNRHDLPWTLDSLDWDRLACARVRHDEDLFLLLCAASFVESGSALYTRNLVAHFAGDDDLQTWLGQHWEPEELQHGRALAAYVRAVWPEFAWEAAYQAFLGDYAVVCGASRLEPRRGLELAARCVVETGTASRYRALHDLTDEPLLRELTGHIKRDEVGHFEQFYRHYRRYREQDGLGRYPVLGAVWRRVREIREEGSDLAMRHVFNRCHRPQADDDVAFRRVAGRAKQRLRKHVPARMTVKMLIKPLELPAPLQGLLARPLTRLGDRLLLQ